MEALPTEIVRVLREFEDVFSERIWDWVQVLVIGASLTPGQRPVAAVPRVMGQSDEREGPAPAGPAGCLVRQVRSDLLSQETWVRILLPMPFFLLVIHI